MLPKMSFHLIQTDMNDFDFIPANDVRTEPDMNVVALFLKAILKKGYYNAYPMDGVLHRLTDQGVFTSCSVFSSEYKTHNFVTLLPCDIEYAWQVLREKGYHLRTYDSVYEVDKIKWAKPADRAGYYLF